MPAPQVILDLVERFHRQIDAYKSGSYNETQVRREFLDPFFKALGWDVDNTSGYAEAYKDVIHEDSIKIGGFTKAPDYCFRIGGMRKFFLEAKKPSVNIKDDTNPAFQLRRYAWSAKLPLSILSDFEELSVYDCRIKPVKTDKSATARTLYITYDEYPRRWDEIAAVFSRDAILKGSFDTYADTAKGKKGTAEVDAAFLKEIESWRDVLARNIALRNPQLTQRELNFAVQQTIDRIIFLRICEDRGIDEYNRLLSVVNGQNIYRRLCEVFQQADDKYNSGLFHFSKEKGRDLPDELTLGLDIDDKPLKDIIGGLYYPDCPYEFSVLSSDILGQVYEQFLGKVIRLTDGHRAVIEDKPEVKKAGGVYYTPTYIVDYIVKNTVGALAPPMDIKTSPPLTKGDKGGFPVAAKALPAKPVTPKQVEKLRILDPACGSGSFLIGAYQYLLDWHRDWYVADNPQKWATGKTPALYQSHGEEWKLTTAERRRILLNNIYGVDIDPQAVEVTKLSLLLKVLEGESEQTLSRQLKLLQERALPDLDSNIKCGNSLIGPDFYTGHQASLFDDEERLRVNVFDWNAEFPDIMKSGGFDAVIGNPPYGIPFVKEEQNYLLEKYGQSKKYPDSYCFFIIQTILLARSRGVVSMIVPNTFCDLESCKDLRYWLFTSICFDEIWQTGWAFKSAIVDTLVFRFLKENKTMDHEIHIKVADKKYSRRIKEFLADELLKIDYRNTADKKTILDRVSKNSLPFGSLATIKAGVKMYEKGKGNPPQTDITLMEKPYSVKGACADGWRLLYRGGDIARYRLASTDEFINYGPWIAAPRNPELFISPKIIMRRTDDTLRASIDFDSAICVNSCHVIKINKPHDDSYSHHYFLGILNSKLLQSVFQLQNPQMVGKVFAEIKVIYVERLPIHIINFDRPEDKARHDSMVGLVEQMLALNKQLAVAKTAHEKTALQRQIDATDNRIDNLVYDLYGLSDEEIKIVEQGR